ncbi:hypothetical protein TSAR_011762 [Trichomalopsis sarcophagae]|uniref:Uncharacterized protein n=1 Tax=Trichomalopsis sarcophagae TaxID=543379 RepID=A0A232EM59_9HYME|nr:hypothetical protein TSAR_011762 [Trichomalopsis sarcophagae]
MRMKLATELNLIRPSIEIEKEWQEILRDYRAFPLSARPALQLKAQIQQRHESASGSRKQQKRESEQHTLYIYL